jgi:hypothetical protein
MMHKGCYTIPARSKRSFPSNNLLPSSDACPQLSVTFDFVSSRNVFPLLQNLNGCLWPHCCRDPWLGGCSNAWLNGWRRHHSQSCGYSWSGCRGHPWPGCCRNPWPGCCRNPRPSCCRNPRPSCCRNPRPSCCRNPRPGCWWSWRIFSLRNTARHHNPQ